MKGVTEGVKGVMEAVKGVMEPVHICSAVAFNEHMEVTPNLQPNWFLSDSWKSGAPITMKCVVLWDGVD